MVLSNNIALGILMLPVEKHTGEPLASPADFHFLSQQLKRQIVQLLFTW